MEIDNAGRGMLSAINVDGQCQAVTVGSVGDAIWCATAMPAMTATVHGTILSSVHIAGRAAWARALAQHVAPYNSAAMTERMMESPNTLAANAAT